MQKRKEKIFIDQTLANCFKREGSLHGKDATRSNVWEIYRYLRAIYLMQNAEKWFRDCRNNFSFWGNYSKSELLIEDPIILTEAFHEK